MGRSRVSDEQLREAVPQAKDLFALLTLLGLVPCGGNYEIARRRLEAVGLLDERFRRRPRGTRPAPSPVDPAALDLAVRRSGSYAEVLRRLGLDVEPRAYRPLRAAIAEAGLSTEHFSGRGWASGTRRPRTPTDELLVAGRRTESGSLRRRLLAEGLLPPGCSGCGLEEWQGRPIALELDHVDGDRDDNRLENLRLLCPNCHAQTDTWRGRNIARRAARTQS